MTPKTERMSLRTVSLDTNWFFVWYRGQQSLQFLGLLNRAGCAARSFFTNFINGTMTRGKELILHSTAFTGVGDKGGFIPIILKRYTDGMECKGCIMSNFLYESV